jgi:hypothetical protein
MLANKFTVVSMEGQVTRSAFTKTLGARNSNNKNQNDVQQVLIKCKQVKLEEMSCQSAITLPLGNKILMDIICKYYSI